MGPSVRVDPSTGSRSWPIPRNMRNQAQAGTTKLFVGALLGVVLAALTLSPLASARPGVENASPIVPKLRKGTALDSRAVREARRVDTDRDGLSDYVERTRTRTDPRRADTDGDGYGDGVEVLLGSNPRDPRSVPGKAAPTPPANPAPTDPVPAPPANPQPPANPVPSPPAPKPPAPPTPERPAEPEPPAPEPPVEPEPPAQPEPQPPAEPATPAAAVWTAPSAAKTGTAVALDGSASTGADPISCTWNFENASGSVVFQTKRGCEVPFTFESTGTKYVRLNVVDGKGDSDSNRQSFQVSAAPAPQPEPPAPQPQPPAPEPQPEPEPPAPQPEPPAPPASGCTVAATRASTAAQVRSAVSADKDVCVTAAVGDVNLENLGSSAVVISTDGGSMGYVNLKDTTDVTISNARFRSVLLYQSHRTALLNNTIGGTATNRVLDQLIFMPARSDDVRIEGNDIGWTRADNSGNTGYGCRCYGEVNRLRFVGNKVHDIAADGFQGGGNGADVLIDRNEIGPVGANPGSNEHSDNIQIVGNGPNLRITNNWIHHQGYFDGAVTGNAGSMYIHGGTGNALLIENNFFQIARGRTEICGLGTGGRERSNITIRRNTWVDGGQSYSNFPSFEWDCTGGSGNVVARNLAIDPDGGFAQNGSASAAAFSANLWGQPSAYSLDASGNCVSAACNPAGAEPIGYRKPSGVSW